VLGKPVMHRCPLDIIRIVELGWGFEISMATVVIVEDNRDIAGLYQRVFEHHQTHVLGNAREAIGYLQQDCPDLLILDFYLESGSGFHVLQYVRTTPHLEDVPVLAVSADDMLRDSARNKGVDAFLVKPFHIADLIKTAQHLMALQRQKRNLALQAVLEGYVAAYQNIYHRTPAVAWDGECITVGGETRGEQWILSETRRLRSLTGGGGPRNYVSRLIDKIRRM
jgi:CheY-like chemotaxis protein